MIGLKLDDNVVLPAYQTKGSVGFDVSAMSIVNIYKGDKPVSEESLERAKKGFRERGYIKLRPFERILFDTGIKAIIPDNIELQVRPRSGLAVKRGLTVINTPGTIDSDYQGKIMIGIYNSTPFLNKIEKGERIAQIVPKEKITPELKKIDSLEHLEKTDRAEGGFGSTGKK